MIKNLIIIAIILGTVIASQTPQVKSWGQNTYSWIEKKTDPYTSKTNDFLKDKVYSAIGGEVSKKTEQINQEVGSTIETQKEKIYENLAEKLKNYFSNIVDSIFFPGRTDQPSSTNNSSSYKNPLLSSDVQECIESCQIPKTQ